ncbi:MAG: hypothetical protein DRJ64_02880 [Thermoprotei archaeon]|nr:MAG: hypothetical protein DRJ64_02880 [Thermoprotei archaeon]
MEADERHDLALNAADSFICYQDTEDVAQFMIDNMPTDTMNIFSSLSVTEIADGLEHPALCQENTHRATLAIAKSLEEVEYEVFRDFVINYHDREFASEERDETD